MSAQASPTVRSGRVVLQRLVDVADAIDLGHVRAQLARGQTLPADELATSAAVPPLSLALGTIAWTAGAQTIEGRATARLYEFGVAALAFTCDVAHMDWDALMVLVDVLAPVSPAGPCVGAWDAITHRLLATTDLALREGNGRTLAEQHVVVAVDAFERPLDAASVRRQLDLARLLSGDPGVLSGETRRQLLGHCFSHHADDLVAVGRQRSFIYRSASTPGLVEVLEAAHARLLELRYYNDLLYEELPRMYALVARTHRRLNVLGPRRMANLARRLYTLVAEVTELTEKLDASMHVAGSTHLARVYAAALELLQVAALNQAVDRKLAIVRDTYAALYDEAAASRAGLLELIIIVLISLEIVLALASR